MHLLHSKPKVFLADCIHNQFGYIYGVPLNIGYLAANLKQKFNNHIYLELFKFPDKLIKSLNKKPDILGLSNYDWNVNLNKVIISIAKEQNPDVFVVMGGPNIRRGRKGVKQFLKQNPQVNAYVLYEGEDAFAGIVAYSLGHEGRLQDTLVRERVELPQVAYLSDDDSLIMGQMCPSIFIKQIPHPSAWLSGYLDLYLNNRDFPLTPILETTRGCPYQCTYCTLGKTTDAKIFRQFSIDTVLEELEYIFKKAEREFVLLIADTNVGILERDLQIVEKIRCLSDQYGKVTHVALDVSKTMHPRNMEIYKILGDISMPIFAQQTFNEEVLANIKRKNVSYKETKILVEAAHASGAQVTTDLMVGLPGESKEAHIDSIKMAFDAGFDKFQIADTRLLLGTEMEEDHARKKYGLKTKVRIIPNAFGIYGGRKVIDYENCIRETNSMSEKEFLELRLLHGHIFLMLNLEIGRPLLDFGKNHGLHQIHLISEISKIPPKNKYPLLNRQFLEYINFASNEWFDTQEDADAYYMQDEIFGKLQKEGFPKLNYEYASNLIANRALIEEFFNWTAWNIKTQLPEIDPMLVDEIVSFTNKRIICFPIDKASMEVMEISDMALKEVGKYVKNYYPDVSLSSRKCLIEFFTDKKQIEKITKIMSTITNARNERHAIQMVIQMHSKIFIRNVQMSSDYFINK